MMALALADPGRTTTTKFLADGVDLLRLDATRQLDPHRRSELGQFLTPPAVAQFMASLFERLHGGVRLLDAGAGVGSLSAAVLSEACTRKERPKEFDVVAYELDETMAEYLRSAMRACASCAASEGVRFRFEVKQGDFIRHAVSLLAPGLFRRSDDRGFTHAILNPPYKKLSSSSESRSLLRQVGVETSNLYAAFLALAVRLLEPGGELVAITPRSFCNGPYFRPFRELLLGSMSLQRIHLFDSRTTTFAEDGVLQENIVLHAVKRRQTSRVVVSSSAGPGDDVVLREAPFSDIVQPSDPERFIRVVSDGLGQQVAELHSQFMCSLRDLGISVSTGRVVDFRAKEYLRAEPEEGALPLVYPTHFDRGVIAWPKPGRKPNALVDCPGTRDLWIPTGTYVLVKRFSSKEEKRRVVAAIFEPRMARGAKIGFENHLNVFHSNGAGLDPAVARGLAVFLNSTLVDAFFRQFNGHTQVNATDLRNLRYPPLDVLRALGARVGSRLLGQEQIDELVEEILEVNEEVKGSPMGAKKKIEEALAVLRALGLPSEQQNERSALTLLALLDLKPRSSWAESSAPLMGITPMMNFFSEHYGKTYKPNTRETVRRFTIHQFVQAGLVALNPDKPTRAVNSPKAVYQIEPLVLEVLRYFGTPRWQSGLAGLLATLQTLQSKYEQARLMNRLPVVLPQGQTMTLSPGGQSELMKQVIEQFCPRFTPGGNVLYVGDAGDKFALFDRQALAALGVEVDTHGKMPDVIIHHVKSNWLVLIEAVTSHGPVNPKRLAELKALFKGSRAGLVYVTAFMDRRAMVKYLGDISWETEVWVADAPDHMIHFDGERFLGPY